MATPPTAETSEIRRTRPPAPDRRRRDRPAAVVFVPMVLDPEPRQDAQGARARDPVEGRRAAAARARPPPRPRPRRSRPRRRSRSRPSPRSAQAPTRRRPPKPPKPAAPPKQAAEPRQAAGGRSARSSRASRSRSAPSRDEDKLRAGAREAHRRAHRALHRAARRGGLTRLRAGPYPDARGGREGARRGEAPPASTARSCRCHEALETRVRPHVLRSASG